MTLLQPLTRRHLIVSRHITRDMCYVIGISSLSFFLLSFDPFTLASYCPCVKTSSVLLRWVMHTSIIPPLSVCTFLFSNKFRTNSGICMGLYSFSKKEDTSCLFEFAHTCFTNVQLYIVLSIRETNYANIKHDKVYIIIFFIYMRRTSPTQWSPVAIVQMPRHADNVQIKARLKTQLVVFRLTKIK
jgi:hypothetical protein